jgi:UDP-N-acetylmuramate dehydrogenase
MTQQLSDRRMKEIFGTDVFVGDVFANEPMRDHTTLRIGGPADIYVMTKNIVSLKNLIIALHDEGVPATPVGGGSNLLVSDDGIAGAVISTTLLNHIEMIEESANEVRLFVEAGTPLQKLVNLARAHGYRGIEGLTGIPGCMGGALLGNAGSYGHEVGDVVESVTVLDARGKVYSIDRDAIGFAYRQSAIPSEVVILSGNVRLEKDDPREVAKRTADFLEEKLRSQPVSQSSAGCVFKNPPGARAGRLIDEAGCKGMRRGDVEVSSLHANFFINRGNGKAADFLGLMAEVKEMVMKAFGVELEAEIKVVGRFRSAANG